MELVKILQGKIEKINETVGLDASILGEKINPKVFGIIRDLRGTENEKEKVLKELEEEQFGGGELFWQPLKDFGLERLREFCESLPHGIQSGLRKGFRGIFFYYKYEEDYHLWYLYDVANDSFITNKTEILNFISCKESEIRIVPEDLDVFEIHHKVREKIRRDFGEIRSSTIRALHGRMPKWWGDMKNEFDFIKENYLEENESLQEKIDRITSSLSDIALTKRRMKTTRKIWKDYKSSKNWHVMIGKFYEFVKEKPSYEEREEVTFDERKLKLICVDFIS